MSELNMTILKKQLRLLLWEKQKIDPKRYQSLCMKICEDIFKDGNQFEEFVQDHPHMERYKDITTMDEIDDLLYETDGRIGDPNFIKIESLWRNHFYPWFLEKGYKDKRGKYDGNILTRKRFVDIIERDSRYVCKFGTIYNLRHSWRNVKFEESTNQSDSD